MSKFLKRLKKSGARDLTNIIVLGSAFGNLQLLLETSNNVFALSSADYGERARNLIYRENFNEIMLYPEINAVFVDRKHIYDLGNPKPILVRYTPAIFIEGENFLSREESTPIGLIGYKVVEIFKGIQTWKIKS